MQKTRYITSELIRTMQDTIAKPVQLIINPHSAGGKTATRVHAILRLLEERGIAFTPHFTERRGHAQELVAAFDGTVETIVAVGGDGTINEIINAAAGKDIVLGVIPSGTGNDFARLLGLRDSEAGVASIAARTERLLDTALIRIETGSGRSIHRRFINTMGIGFDAAVAYRVSRKAFGAGVLPYLFAVFQELRSFSSVRASLTADGDTRDTTLFLATVGNGTTSGGGFILSPLAVPDDGILDLCLVRDVGILRVLSVLPKTFRGAHLDAPEVLYVRSKEFGIRLSSPMPVHADGELIAEDALALSVSVDPASARVLVAP